eukprot:8600700-Pyramimonas_sp.AAC.1
MAQQLADSVKVLHDSQAGREALTAQIDALTGQLENRRKEVSLAQEDAFARAKELAELRTSNATLKEEVTELREDLKRQLVARTHQTIAHSKEIQEEASVSCARAKELAELRELEATLKEEVNELRNELIRQTYLARNAYSRESPEDSLVYPEESTSFPVSKELSSTSAPKTRKVLAFGARAPDIQKGYTSVEVALIVFMWSFLVLSSIGGWLWIPVDDGGPTGPRPT